MEPLEESPLEQAERHIHQGEEHIAKQRALIARLEEKGHVQLLPAAIELLTQMEQSLATHRDHAEIERRTPN